MKTKKQIYLLDTTLRDGQQSPGAGMSLADNIQYAHIAHQLNIDVLEAGFPAASSTDFAIVTQISHDMASIQSSMIISALAQMKEAQIVKTMEALSHSVAIHKARLHMYVPVDPHLMAASIGSLADNKQQIITMLGDLVKLAHSSGFEVEFSPEGYSRQGDNFSFVTDLIRAAVSNGATIINCPDTIGGASRYQGESYFINYMAKHKAIIDKEFDNNQVIWSMHCHNDFGLALENTMYGVFSGIATQIEGCINGVGERAGNVALEQCAMIIRQFGTTANAHQEYFTNINFKQLKAASDFIAEKMLPRQPHFPIIGTNATTHSSGGHTNAIINNPLSYQPFDPKDIGGEIILVFSPLSGSNHAQSIIVGAGYQCNDNEKIAITQFIKDYYHDRRKGITDTELITAYKKFRAPIIVDNIQYTKNNDYSQLIIEGQLFDKNRQVFHYSPDESLLVGLNNSLNTYLNTEIIVRDYRSSSRGSDVTALSLSEITVESNGKVFIGKANDYDIEISALKAFIDAANQVYVEQNYKI